MSWTLFVGGSHQHTGVREKKHALGKFDAKAFFEAWGTAFDVVFREESEFKVKNDPNLLKYQDFWKNKNLKIYKNS